MARPRGAQCARHHQAAAAGLQHPAGRGPTWAQLLSAPHRLQRSALRSAVSRGAAAASRPHQPSATGPRAPFNGRISRPVRGSVLARVRHLQRLATPQATSTP
ncbi:hypothetical protein NDU88_004033 [Pleurodeles waltl]|uniref:Uncharacterized protein n=1 Tax=Pleurodeles waltl TaxID=8319 RepID=A0AAV7SHR1_PLEWA|nr:hypothetical protein NDU88_004033 [Pleurodeles waltl]